MRASLVLLAALLAIALSYWLSRGSAVFRMELRDFRATPDDLNEATRRSARDAAAVARIVSWRLADGSRQRAYYLPPRNGAVIVYAHGAPGAGSGFLPVALAMAEHGYGALLLDLPGYGESEGRRDWGPAFQAAIRRAVDFAVAQPGVDPRRIGGFGYSMSGQAMARAAADDPRIAALILLATFTNLTDQLHYQFRSRIPGLSWFAIGAARYSGLPVSDMDTQRALPTLGQRPVLVISGRDDWGIPPRMAAELSSSAAAGAHWIVDGVGHVGFAERVGRAYFDRLRTFWDSALGADSKPAVR